jgi:CO/xanthine dehydrogenase Mo-binding subunit
MIAIVPAIANAIAHAIGKRFYELPITPDKVLKVLS